MRGLRIVTMFGSGLVFGLGLVVAGMTQPAKVVGFLDFTGNWDPSLAFVMVGAILVHWLLYRFILHWPSPIFASSFGIPKRRDIDKRLVTGSAVFGLGWGLAGYCPGPGLVSLGSLGAKSFVFVATMLTGMLLFSAWEAWTKRKPSSEPKPEPRFDLIDASSIDA